MKNSETIFNGKPYADLSVRECMDLSKNNEDFCLKIKECIKTKKKCQ